jgi:hypothetical protein
MADLDEDRTFDRPVAAITIGGPETLDDMSEVAAAVLVLVTVFHKLRGCLRCRPQSAGQYPRPRHQIGLLKR